MASNTNDAVLAQIMESLLALRKDNSTLASAVDEINGRVNMLAGVKQVHDAAAAPVKAEEKPKESVTNLSEAYDGPIAAEMPKERRTSTTSKIILTSYPGQAGVDPLPMDWGNRDPTLRGPVVVSRHPNTIRRRNGE